MKLLLAEDEPRMADALKELLQQEGYDVDFYARGDDTLLAMCSEQYDGVVLDVMLPGLSGIAVASQSRKAGVITPILMLSAKGELDNKVSGLDAGADDYLTKPFQPRELLARVRALCRRGLPLAENNLTFGICRLTSKHSTSPAIPQVTASGLPKKSVGFWNISFQSRSYSIKRAVSFENLGL